MKPKRAVKEVRRAPPGLPPKILSPTSWDVFYERQEPPKEVAAVIEAVGEQETQGKGAKVRRSEVASASQRRRAGRKATGEGDAYMDKLVEENRDVTDEGKGYVQEERRGAPLSYMEAPQKPEGVNMLKGWCREEEGWVKVRSVMDSGAGVSVAPPGMCPARPIVESEGSRRGQEFVSASEDTLPNLGEQKLSVVLDNDKETVVKYQIADVSRALNSVAEICDAGHPEYGNQVIFGRGGGEIVNLATGKTTYFGRENNIYCLDFWVKPFQGQGR